MDLFPCEHLFTVVLLTSNKVDILNMCFLPVNRLKIQLSLLQIIVLSQYSVSSVISLKQTLKPSSLLALEHEWSSCTTCAEITYYSVEASLSNKTYSVNSLEYFHRGSIPIKILQVELQQNVQNSPYGYYRFFLYCQVLLIATKDPNNGPKINLKSFRNPKIYKSNDFNNKFESDQTYIFLVKPENTLKIISLLSHDNPRLSTSVKTASLQNQHFRIGIFNLKPQYFSHGGRTVGIAYKLVENASKKYNFTFDLSFTIPAIVPLEDGTLTGLDNDLVYDRVDMILLYTASFLEPDRVEATSYYSTASMIFVGLLPSVDIDWRAILFAFAWETWLAVLIAVVIVSIVVFLELKTLEGCKNPASVSCLAVYGALVGQSFAEIPRPARNLVIVWLFVCLILVNYYTSNLLSLLTDAHAEEVPQDFYSLASRNDYKINIQDLPGGPMEQYFNMSTSAELVTVRNRYSPIANLIKCVTDALTTAKQVCIGWDFIVEGIVETNATINERFYPTIKSKSTPLTVLTNAILQKNSPYLLGMNQIVCWFRDTGHYFRWLDEAQVFIKQVGKEWLMSQSRTNYYQHLLRVYVESTQLNIEPFRMTHLRTPFGALIIGIILAICALGYELVARKSSSIQVDKTGKQRSFGNFPKVRQSSNQSSTELLMLPPVT